MGYVELTYLRLTNSRFCFMWARINNFKACDGFTRKWRLQSTQDGNLVKIFWWEKSKMATVILQILDFFPLKREALHNK